MKKALAGLAVFLAAAYVVALPYITVYQIRQAVEMRDSGVARLDLRPIGQRRGQVLGKQARSRPGRTAIDRREQAPRAPAALRFDYFEAGARRGVHCQPLVAAPRDRRQQQRQRPAPDMIEIGDQSARRRQHGSSEIAKAIERRDTEQRL